MILVRPLLGLINTPPELLEMATRYLRIFIAGLVFMFLYNGLGSILRRLWDSRTPLIFLSYATIINIILDPLMIFGVGPFPRLGVAGAALATVIAQGISVFLLVRHLAKINHLLPDTVGQWRIDRQLTATTFRIGLPAGVQQLMVSLGSLVLTSIIDAFGPTVIAAFGAASRLDQFAFMPAMSTSLAISSLVGQNVGAGRYDRVKYILRWGTLMTGGITSMATLLVLLTPKSLLSLFTTDQAVLIAGANYLRIVGLSYLPLSMMFAINGALRGAGDTMPNMFTTLAALWLVRIPLAKALSSWPVEARL
ncbi:MAG TPA: MATE family efflux transporter [Firmicutes bacterium]|nr:MATE family efflux transporter [Bacillota bacterium]